MRALKLVLLTCLLAIGQAASAGVVTWTLNDFRFTDGATAIGSFQWDSETESVLSWDFILSPSANGSPVNYSSLTGMQAMDTVSFQTLTFFEEDPRWDFRFALTDLTLLGTPVAMLGLGSSIYTGGTGYLECANCAQIRFGVAGAFLTGVSVPEPGTLGLLGLGLAGLGFARRRKAA